MIFHPVTNEEVDSVIKSLKYKKASGTVEVPSNILKYCREYSVVKLLV